jgi:hypothetical protein
LRIACGTPGGIRTTEPARAENCFVAELDRYHALGHDHGLVNGMSMERNCRPFVHLELGDEERT